MRPATTSLLAFFLALLLAACGDPPPTAAVTIPIPSLEPGTDRTVHVTRALELARDPESRALLLRVAPGALPEGDRVRQVVTEIAKRSARPEELRTREAAVALDALSGAHLVHRSQVPPSVLVGLTEALLARRLQDGTWGDPVTTALAVGALVVATAERPWLAERLDATWRAKVETGIRTWLRDPTRWEPDDRIHLAVLVLALASESWPEPPLETQKTVRRLIRDVPVDGDADLLLAWARLWWRAGPATGPEHPAAAAQRRFRERYEAGELSASSPEELVKLVVALEMFGYDSFGAILGYLPDCRWEPSPDR